jgi:quercetin dioxygenase-like cupin family protein
MEDAMTRLAVMLAGIVVALVPRTVMAEEVPDAFSVEWQGKHLCEKLYEDSQVRIGRCTFPPGAVHACHSHPGYFGFTLSGGRGQVRDARGIRQGETKPGDHRNNPPIPWHEYTNTGDTTISFLVVEKKYQPAPASDQNACK